MAKEAKAKAKRKSSKNVKQKTTRRTRNAAAKRRTAKLKTAKRKTAKQQSSKTANQRNRKTERREEEKKIVYARAKYLKGSAQKARLVADLVRGMNAQEAIDKLRFVQKSASRLIQKAIESAMANASNNFEMDKKSLVIKEIYVDEAPTFRRGRAGSRGRYQKLLKRNCHIIVGLLES
jgi:large subunit ribosomal protein L22